MSWGCVSCGGANPEGTRFCGHCGAPHAPAAPPPTLTAQDVRSSVAAVAGLVSSDLARRDGDGREVVNRPLAERLATAQVAVEERRLITALFADVSGFTALAHGLEAERLVEIIGPIVSRLAHIVERYGGYVGKFAGDAILAFFGAPVSHEDDAARALLAAGDMQREMADVLAGLGPEAAHLTLHVGVNTGYVVAGHFGGEVQMEYSVLGDAVNVAQRLEAAAPGGAVYVGHETHRLTSDRFTFDGLGLLTVKGKPDPIRAWRLGSEIPASVRRAGTGGAPQIVGRARELDELERVLGSVASGAGGVVAVVGEPGIGKSGLLGEARRRGGARGVRWLETHCVVHHARPYRPYVELLRVLAEIPEEVPPESAAARVVALASGAGVPAAAPYFLRLLGLPASPGAADATPSDPLLFRHDLQRAMVEFLAGEAAARPLVLCVEDLQWADDASAELTRLVAARAPSSPFGLVVTARPEARAEAEAIAASGSASAVLTLGALDRDAARELAADVLGGAASSPLVDVVVSRTSGNPLFTQQVLRSLVDGEALEQSPDGWRLRAGWSADAVPLGVEQVLAARIDQLPRPAADTLQIASVIGRDFLPALLERVAAGAGAGADGTVDLLLRRGFLVAVGAGGETRLFFQHALLVDVASGRLFKARRRDIHRTIVRAIVGLYGSGGDVIDALARHAYRGEMGETAVDYLSRAADRAAGMFANEQAVAYLRQALELEQAGASRHELLLRCARLEEVRGAYAAALSLYDDVLASSGDLHAAAGKVSTLRKLGEFRRCLDTIEAAREAARGGSATVGPDAAARLAYEEGWVLAAIGEGRRAVAVLTAGLDALAGRDHRVQAELLIMLARTEEMLGAHGPALEHAGAALAGLDEQRDLPLIPTVLRILGGIEHDAGGRGEEASRRSRATLERALAAARRTGNAEEEAAALTNLGRVLADLGLLDDAIRCDREAAAAFEAVGLKGGVACAYCNLADHLDDAGRFEESRQAAERGLEVAREIGHAYWIAGGLIGVAGACMALGDDADAIALADEAVQVAEAHGHEEQAADARRIGARARGRLEASR